MAITALLALALAASGAAAEAEHRLGEQVSAWNRGDLESALGHYCDSEAITWVNRQGISRGFGPFAEGMRADFADPAKMGTYRTELLERRALGKEAALLVIRWSIMRGEERLMGGVSTQLWQPCRGRLRITLEHAS